MIVGEKEEIDDFSIFAQRMDEGSAKSMPEHQPQVLVKTVHLDKNHPLVNKSISDPHVKESLQGLIIGLDSQGEHILNPPLQLF